MSREELVIEIAATLHTADEQGVLEGSCAEFLKPLAELIERLLAQEREKVREICAVEILKRAGELRELLKTIEESCGPGDVDAETERLRMGNRAEELELVAAAIRQLDLIALNKEGK